MRGDRLKRSLASVAVSALLLAGCATAPGEIIRNLTSKETSKELQRLQYSEYFQAHILSSHSPYSVSYHVTIRGAQPQMMVKPQLLASGQHETWTWTIKAFPQVAAALRQWQARKQSVEANRTQGTAYPSEFDWSALMQRLYAVDQFLLGSPPMPLDIQILLIPREKFGFHGTVHSDQALPVRLILNDTDLEQTSRSFDLVQTATLLVLIQLQQGLFADAEWKAGLLPKTVKSDRKLKFFVNQMCFESASRIAVADLLAGNGNLPELIEDTLIPQPLNGFRSLMVKAVYHWRPSSFSAQQAMANELLSTGLQSYLKQLGLPASYPHHGRDIRQVNAVLNYCRAFIHYTGDIGKQSLPPESIPGGEFFHSSPTARP